jgi:hypothetical protein
MITNGIGRLPAASVSGGASRRAGRHGDRGGSRFACRTQDEQKLLTLSLDEFLCRFLLHVLPKGFVRIRNFGFLANRRRATLLPLCFHLLGSAPQTEQPLSIANDANDLRLCPECGGPMRAIERLTAAEIQLRSPPTLVTVAA